MTAGSPGQVNLSGTWLATPYSALVRGHLVRPPAWLIFAALLAVLGYLLLRHEQDPLQDLARSRPDDGDAPPGTRPATSGQDEPLADK